ncbi:amidohydrolase family protein [Candidatus Formimonas warabiya]|uniref:Amidohydrolase-related domain-containing protein n=1 Tax=Formimonas warabiya TaxID=1761012 RepID=A0A3G1KR71_FORW1|nr:amidohydrolase family protein [Candidatus Formimonas warabiya]ATW24605.1 hypothetical protein DCMF_07235 [Candidatus Formimonas warabiya]
MGNILIKNADHIYPFDAKKTYLHNTDIYIENNRIAAIGKNLLLNQSDKVIDGAGKLALPGLINTHHHFYQNVTRNVPITQKGGLLRWLLFSYGAWADIDEEAVYAAARLSAAELLLTGCTTTMDFMYFFPYGRKNLMDQEFRALKELGMRFHGYRGCMPVMEGNLPEAIKQVLGMDHTALLEDREEILQACAETFKKHHDAGEFAMSRVGVGPTTTVFEMKPLMQDLKILANKYGGLCHTHLHPRPDEYEKCHRLYHCTPHEWLEYIGWFDSATSIAHATQHRQSDIRILARTGVAVTHSPSCHMRLGYPMAPIPAMVKAGVTIGIGVDGGASNDSGDMFAELRNTMYVHRIKNMHDNIDFQDWFGPQDVFSMATNGGAKVLKRDDIGSLEVGKGADIILVDMNQIAYGGALADPLGALVYCGYNHLVHTSIINGRVVVENSRLITGDEQHIISDANRVAKRILDHVKKRTGIDYYQAYIPQNDRGFE